MKTMKLFLLSLMAVFLASPVWAADQGAKKDLLVGPEAVLWCGDLTPTSWEDSSQIQDGFVIFNYADGSGKLMATVKLKGAEPYTEYPVRLIQGGGSDCHVVDAYLTTNKKGNGVVHFDEIGLDANGDGLGLAQVIIDTGILGANPTWRATDIFYFYL